MNFREKIIGKIRGENDCRPLFVPRLDIWYNANKMRNKLPGELKDLSLMEVSQKLGVGFHAVVPTFLSSGNIEDIYHRGLGLYNMLSSSCSDGDFKDFFDRLLEECYPFNNLIFSVADTLPSDANFDCLLYICEKVNNNVKKENH